MNALPRPTQTLTIMESILTGALDSAQRLEVRITEIEADLREGGITDWREGALIILMNAARSRMCEEITRAANALRTVTALREKAGMSEHVVIRVMRECGL